jgi:hypothetical protein
VQGRQQAGSRQVRMAACVCADAEMGVFRNGSKFGLCTRAA